MRDHIEAGNADGTANALDRNFHYSGRAIVITSLILAMGFAPFALSDYFTTFITGTLLPGCFFVALSADLLLVPALIKPGSIRFPPSGRGKVYKLNISVITFYPGPRAGRLWPGAGRRA